MMQYCNLMKFKISTITQTLCTSLAKALNKPKPKNTDQNRKQKKMGKHPNQKQKSFGRDEQRRGG